MDVYSIPVSRTRVFAAQTWYLYNLNKHCAIYAQLRAAGSTHATYTVCTRDVFDPELSSTSMTDSPQCWLKHREDCGAASPVRPAALLVTRPEAARILSVSVREIDRLRRAGRLLAKMHGARVVFPLSELERYAESLPWEVDSRP